MGPPVVPGSGREPTRPIGQAPGCRSRGARSQRNLTRFLAAARVELLFADEHTTHHDARLFRQLRVQGTPIPTSDLWTAALTVQHGAHLFARWPLRFPAPDFAGVTGHSPAGTYAGAISGGRTPSAPGRREGPLGRPLGLQHANRHPRTRDVGGGPHARSRRSDSCRWPVPAPQRLVDAVLIGDRPIELRIVLPGSGQRIEVVMQRRAALGARSWPASHRRGGYTPARFSRNARMASRPSSVKALCAIASMARA